MRSELNRVNHHIQSRVVGFKSIGLNHWFKPARKNHNIWFFQFLLKNEQLTSTKMNVNLIWNVSNINIKLV